MSRALVDIVFAGGGSGGHYFAGLAVAEQIRLMRPKCKIAFAGTGKAWERDLADRYGCTYLPTPSRPYPKRRWSAASFLAQNAFGYCSALRRLRRLRVRLVVGLGGYASAPAARAAVTCGIPLVLLEQNAIPGKVNRWLSPRAELICAAYRESETYLRRAAAFCVTGNPVRQAASGVASETARGNQILVVGGSRGAKSLNLQLPRVFAGSSLAERGWSVLHQSGHDGLAETQSLYESLGFQARVVPFIDDLPGELIRSKLAICRAGGSTLAELAVAGTPAILCPYPWAADDHQARNAASFAADGACLVVDERQPTESFLRQLSDALELLSRNEVRWSECSAAMLRRSQPCAARRVAELLLERISARLPAG